MKDNMKLSRPNKVDLKNMEKMVWTGFILVMTGPNGGLFMFHKKLKIS
jgi:hypothetical protein